jgi:aryl hydrocarbon receptor
MFSYFSENSRFLHRSFTVRFRCLLDNTSGFIVSSLSYIYIPLDWLFYSSNIGWQSQYKHAFFQTLEISGWIRVLHGQNVRSEEPQLALFATCCPFGPLSLMDIPSRELTFKSKHKMDFSPMSMDNRQVLNT